MFLKIGEKDNYEIYSMNMDGTGRKNITSTPGVEWVYYAYKDKVYYVSDKDSWVNRHR
jgi:TolB protein